MSNFWPKKWPLSLKKLEKWLLTREFLKQHLTENKTKQNNGYLQSGRVREVVARSEMTEKVTVRN